ncbi:MAG: GGDEF domain-containing protein [Nitrospirae bacterium]|nr:GGDEF domain-containing protein [Nitrospirota bacterium]
MDEETTTGSIRLSRRRMDRVNHQLACLVIVVGPMIGEKFPLSKERMMIGRQREAEIFIDDTSISRRHAEVVQKTDGAVILHDLGSKNGTLCNDEKIREKALKDGDLIRVGDAILKYVGPNSLEHLYLDEMSERASQDGLTGLFNKQAFQAYLARNLSRCKDLREPLSVGMADLDWFKKINDGWGHPAGDYVLREFAGLVKNAVRPADLLARYGGEEFGLILPHTNLAEARIVGERLRGRVEDHAFVFDGQRLPVTVSIGLAERLDGDEEADALIARADKALYQAKRDGRNRTCCFTGP